LTGQWQAEQPGHLVVVQPGCVGSADRHPEIADDHEVARLLGLPLAGQLPVEPVLLRPQASARAPGATGRGPLARFCTHFWERALVELGGTR
jgi:hypothetical protein